MTNYTYLEVNIFKEQFHLYQLHNNVKSKVEKSTAYFFQIKFMIIS